MMQCMCSHIGAAQCSCKALYYDVLNFLHDTVSLLGQALNLHLTLEMHHEASVQMLDRRVCPDCPYRRSYQNLPSGQILKIITVSSPCVL